MMRIQKQQQRFIINYLEAILLLLLMLSMASCSQNNQEEGNILEQVDRQQLAETLEIKKQVLTPVGETTQQPQITVGTNDEAKLILPATNLTIWHTYKTESSELSVLTDLINKVIVTSPGLNINIIQIPSGELISDYTFEVLSGEGPDILLSNNLDIGELARKELILNLDQFNIDWLDSYEEIALESMKVNGILYGIPLTTSTLALYYKQDRIKNPPETTEELLASVQSGNKLVQVLDSFFLYGWGAAFGGKVLYDSDECILDEDGWMNTIGYLEQLEEQGAIYQIDYGNAVETFVTGDSAMFIDGSWALDEYKAKFGKNLGVIKMPKGPINHASPFVISSGFYVNPNSKDIQTSLLLIKYLTGFESVTEFSNNANLVPARIDVEPTLKEVREFKMAVDYGTLLPQSELYKTLWVYFDKMFEEILTDVVPLDESLNNVCNQINEMNEK